MVLEDEKSMMTDDDSQMEIQSQTDTVQGDKKALYFQYLKEHSGDMH